MAQLSPSPTQATATLSEDDVLAIDDLRKAYGQLKAELAKVIVGQEAVIERLAICLFAKGHGLLMGVPGLAKTLLVAKLAETMSLKFSRIQFTPDLMPMDITGTDILQDNAEGRRVFQFVHGPVFANIVLADEINRAPPKTQAAMLEAMQESNVTVLGKAFKLEPPFLVLATQNPVEQEGTYPLPEAQLDRFMFLIELDYPSEAEEIKIARTTTGEALPSLGHLLSPQDVIRHQARPTGAGARPHLHYAARLVRKTRPGGETAPAWLKPLVSWGAGPRAVQYLILGAKARAALMGSLHGPARRRDGSRRAGADPPGPDHLRRPGRGDRRPDDRRPPDRGDRILSGVDFLVGRASCPPAMRLDGHGGPPHQDASSHPSRYLAPPQGAPRAMFPDRRTRSFLDTSALSRLAAIPLFARKAMQGSVSGRTPARIGGRASSSPSIAATSRATTSEAARLAGLRPDRTLLRQGVRGRHEPPVLPGRRHVSGRWTTARPASPRSSTPGKIAGALGYLASLNQGDAIGLSLRGRRHGPEHPPQAEPRAPDRDLRRPRRRQAQRRRRSFRRSSTSWPRPSASGP